MLEAARMKAAGVVVLGVFVAFFLAIVLIVIYVEDSEYGFDHYKTDIDISIRSDGSALITETYDFRWSDTESGEMYVWFPGDKVDRLNMSSISCQIDGRDAAKVSSYNEGSNATYAGPDNMALYFYGTNPWSGDWEINAFYKRAYSGEHTVVFRYELNNAVSRYADCVDLCYKVFTSFSEDLYDLTVTVAMPAGSARETMLIFGHGDPNGRCEFAGDTADAVFKSSKLQAYTMFEIRVVDKQTGLYPTLPIKTDKTLDSILREEKRFQDETDFKIRLTYVQIGLCIGMVLAAASIALLGNRIFKRNRPNFNQPYTRELPGVKPNIEAHFGDYYKLSKGRFGNKVAATILDLALQKVIAIEKGAGKEIEFVSLNGNAPMTKFERSVHDMLFYAVKGSAEKRITLSQLRKAPEGLSAGHLSLFDADRADFDAGRYVDTRLEEQNAKWKILPVFFFVLIFPNMIISMYTEFFEIVPVFFIASFVSMFLTAFSVGKASKPLTVIGEDERAKAQALKRFYTDMTLMKERKAMELPLWEQHLVYATALGVSGKVVKELGIRLTELNVADPRFTSFCYIHTLHRVGGLSKSMSSINETSHAAFVRSAVSEGSRGGGYSGGGGGGFSGGGGGGFGGGGGGHR